MLRPSKINYSYYDLESLRIIEKNIEDDIATYLALINEPGYKEALAASRAKLSSIQHAITEVSKAAPEKKMEVIPAPVEQKSANVVYYNPESRKVRAKPICSFTEAQKALMRRYIEEGEDLDDAATKPLINATIYDEIELDYNFDPALIITEGQISYTFQFLKDYYKKSHPYVDRDDTSGMPHPVFQKTPKLDFPCTKDDIIPCNTLLQAIQLLLAKAERWEKGDKREPSVPELKQPAVKRKYTVLTDQEVEILEIIYKCLPPSRQLMFNVIVRYDSEIMNKAVILPDGFVYDASVAEKQLKLMTSKGKFPAVFEGGCPSNPAITFKVVRDERGQDIYSEIKPALYYDNVIKILQDNVAYFQKVVKVEGMKVLSDTELSDERDGAIFKLSKYLEKIEHTPVIKTDDAKENENLVAIKANQIKVIQAAIHALQFLDVAEFEAVTKECSKVPEQSYAAVKTKFNGINSGKGFFDKIYRAGAYLTGTIHGQIGVEMPTIVARVNALLARCEKSLELSEQSKKKL
jgi:hypothetical protein